MKSFALIEILIYSMISTLIILGVLSFFTPFQNIMFSSGAQTEFERNFAFIANTLSYWIRQAQNASVPTPQELDLILPTSSSALSPTKFRLNNFNLEISQGTPDNWQPLNSSKLKIISLNFEITGTNLISINLQAQSVVEGKQIVRTFRTSVGLRTP